MMHLCFLKGMLIGGLIAVLYMRPSVHDNADADGSTACARCPAVGDARPDAVSLDIQHLSC